MTPLHRFLMTHSVSELFTCQRVSLYITCLVVSLLFFFYVCSQNFQEVSLSCIECQLTLKETIALHFLWKQKHNLSQHNSFLNFHFVSKTLLKYIDWFNSAVPSKIQLISLSTCHLLISFQSIQNQHNIKQDQDTLYIFYLYVTYFYITLLSL